MKPEEPPAASAPDYQIAREEKKQTNNKESMKIKKNIAISETGFVFDPYTGDSYSMNPVGLEILQMLKEDKEQEVIFSALLKKYDVDKDTVEHNYFDFIGMLKQFNLLETNS
jgi:hypothetical protein